MLRWLAPLTVFAMLVACTTTSERRYEAQIKKAATFNAELGAGYLARGNLEQAKVKFEKALDQDEENAKANSGYALLQARLGNHEEADTYFERAIELDPDDSQVLNNYGAYLCDQGRSDDAEMHFLKAAADPLYGTPEFAYRNAGTCALSDGDISKAKSYFQRALEINPRFGPALLDMANINREQRQFQPALTYLERYHKIFPQSPESLWLYAGIYRDLGNRDLASTYETRLTTLFPQSAQARRLRESAVQ
ncbi:MAG: type IV pilus biogenesis/stability protein PilW [Gammaproteobacteria bacterium]|nr:type IV pilus biogenesis/stability protein PilW [Gammaproteobacteria bacterium]